MSSSDLKFIFILAFMFVFWTSFILLFAGNEMSDNLTVEDEQETGLLSSISFSLSFLNPFSDAFNSEFALMNILIFSVLIFGIVVVGARFIRGV